VIVAETCLNLSVLNSFSWLLLGIIRFWLVSPINSGSTQRINVFYPPLVGSRQMRIGESKDDSIFKSTGRAKLPSSETLLPSFPIDFLKRIEPQFPHLKFHSSPWVIFPNPNIFRPFDSIACPASTGVPASVLFLTGTRSGLMLEFWSGRTERGGF
jgi:hypothetical protein